MTHAQHTPYHELIEALGGPDCAVCALALRSLRRYFDALAYEKVNDLSTRAAIRGALGFCAPHGRMLREARAALGAAIIHRDVLTNAGRALSAAAPRPQGLGTLLRQAVGGEAEAARRAAALDPQQPCPACAHTQAIERSYLDLLVQRLDDAALLEALRASVGLCLPHLRRALRRAANPAAFEHLREAQLAAWARLTADLDEFIRKHDHRFTREAPGAEANSWAQAVDLVSGLPGTGGER
jgi:hypothetical protein